MNVNSFIHSLTHSLTHSFVHSFIVLYPQNGDHIVTIDSLSSLHPMYVRTFINRSALTLVPRIAAWRCPLTAADIDSLPVARARAAAIQLHVAAAVDRRDRPTDGHRRTDTVPLHSERKCADTTGTVPVPWPGDFQCYNKNIFFE